MRSILKAMNDGTVSIIATKIKDTYTISIVPKQDELAPITISGDMEEVLFDLDNTDLHKAIGIATDLETVVTDYKTKAEEKKKSLKAEESKTSPKTSAKTPTKEPVAATTTQPTSGGKSGDSDKEEDQELNVFE